MVVEVDEASCFAPVKNAPGSPKDSPEQVRARMIALHTAWLREAGAHVADGVPVEICPLYALDAEEVRRKFRPGTEVTAPLYLR